MLRGQPWLRFVTDDSESGGSQTDDTETGATDSGDGSGDDAGDVDWKAKFEAERAHARKWEDRAKANKDAADKLKEFEDAGKSDAEKESEKIAEAEQRLAAAERRAEEAEAAQTRYRVAAEFKLDPEHAKHLNGDETEMRELASLLAANTGQPRRKQSFGEDRDRTPPAPTLKDGADLFNRVKANLY